MTTAHRPTWAPAQGGKGKLEGGLGGLTQQTSVRDGASHMTLKHRQEGQGTEAENKGRDFKAELEEKERKHHAKQAHDRKREDDLSIGFGTERDSGGGRDQFALPTTSLVKANAMDADDDDDDDSEDDDDDDDSDSSDDDDDTAALLAELEKIKRERAEEQARKDAVREAEEERVRTQGMLQSNPLLRQGGGGDFSVKRRWDDDVVFRNCARQEERNKKAHFINDTLRSEFQKKFLDKYIQ